MTIEQQAPFQFTWREIVNEEYQEWFKRHLRAITVFDHRPSMGQHRQTDTTDTTDTISRNYP
ncbi:hypothetical protein C5H20_06525 [Xylella fastidiosa]|nr:hypothetical protein C5H20_06525 [Xylella fastidiosa]